MLGDFSLYTCPKLRRCRSAERPEPSPWSLPRDAPGFAGRILSGAAGGRPGGLPPGTTRHTGPPRAPKPGSFSRRRRTSDTRYTLPYTFGISFKDSRYAWRSSASMVGETSRGKSTVRQSSRGASDPIPLVSAALARMSPLPMALDSIRTSAFCRATARL